MSSTSSTPLIEARGLYKSYGMEPNRVDVLNGIDLSIDEGDTVAVVGASGVGKSTLLGIIGALDRPTEGEVFYRNESVFGLDDSRLARLRNCKVGFVFQFHHLLPEFTAVENVMLPALIGGRGRAEAEERAASLLRDVGLAERLTHKPGELSGGEQQRVAVTRALMQEPEVVLADEPTGNLDAATGSEVFDMMIEMNEKSGATLVVVTHNEELAGRMSRKFKMENGLVFEC